MKMVTLIGALLDIAGAVTIMASVRKGVNADRKRRAIPMILLILGAVFLAIGALGRN